MNLFCLHLWKIILQIKYYLLTDFFPQYFENVMALISGLFCLAWGSKSLILLDFPYMWWVPSLLLLLIFSLCGFSWFLKIVVCIGVGLFEFILLRLFWTSFMGRLIFFNRFGKCVAIFLWIFFNLFHSLFFLTLLLYILVHLKVSHYPLRLCLFFFLSILSLFFRLYNLYWSIFIYAESLLCQFKSIFELLQWFFHFGCYNF